MLGLSIRELMAMLPGLYIDMLEVWKEQHGQREPEKSVDEIFG